MREAQHDLFGRAAQQRGQAGAQGSAALQAKADVVDGDQRAAGLFQLPEGDLGPERAIDPLREAALREADHLHGRSGREVRFLKSKSEHVEDTSAYECADDGERGAAAHPYASGCGPVLRAHCRYSRKRDGRGYRSIQ